MKCRNLCGACCIAPSITSPIPGMPDGKPQNIPCINLNPDYSCKIHGTEQLPSFCGSLQPSEEMCGKSRDEALSYLSKLEILTSTWTTSAKGLPPLPKPR